MDKLFLYVIFSYAYFDLLHPFLESEILRFSENIFPLTFFSFVFFFSDYYFVTFLLLKKFRTDKLDGVSS